MSFFEPYKSGCILRIKLTPNATKNDLGNGIFVDADGAKYLKAGVTAAPEKGKANKELLKMLAKRLKIAGSSLDIISGQTDHLKKIYINMDLSDTLKQQLISLKKEKI